MDMPRLLELLRCAKSRSPLVHDGDWLISVDPTCRLKYAIKQDIPVLIPEEATEVPLTEWQEIMARHGRDRTTGALSGSAPAPEKPA